LLPATEPLNLPETEYLAGGGFSAMARFGNARLL